MAASPLPAAPATPFAPLPLRPRGAMELLDTSVKLYRQYFGVLLGWSALITAISVVVSLLPGGGIVSFLLSPMEFGVAACCLAAAVRGQRVAFKQCWDFTQPRYGSLLLMSFLCGLILALLIIPVAVIIGVGIGIGGAASGSVALLIGLGVVMIIALLILGSYGTIWYYMVATVVCFEDDKRNTSSMGHAYELLKGQWGRILGITLLLGLIYLILVSIIGAFVWITLNGSEVIAGISSSSPKSINSLTTIVLSWAMLSQLVAMLLTPLLHLCVGMSYLDIRTRKEALDLQWAAHVAAPVAPSPYANPAFINTPGAGGYQNTPQGYGPQSYAPQQNYPQQGYGPQGYGPQGYAPPGYRPEQNSPQAPYPSQQNYPQQGYPPQNYAQQGYPPQSYPPQQSPVSSAPPTATPQPPALQYGPPAAGMTQQLSTTSAQPETLVVLPLPSQPVAGAPVVPAPANVPNTPGERVMANAPDIAPPNPFVMNEPTSPPMEMISSPLREAAPITIDAPGSAMIDNASVLQPVITPDITSPDSTLDFAPLPTSNFAVTQEEVPPIQTLLSEQSLTNTAPTGTSPIATPSIQTGAETVTCPQCGAISPRGQRFCMTCGSTLPTA